MTLVIRAAIVGYVKEVLCGESWSGLPRIQELVRRWISFATATLQSTQISGSNPQNISPSRIVYQTPFYSRFGASVADKSWPYHTFPDILFSYPPPPTPPGMERLDALALLRKALNADIGIYSLEIREGGNQVIGLCPARTRPGDVVTVAMGCQYPLILRPKDGAYEIVGETYICGYMNGECLANFPKTDITLR